MPFKSRSQVKFMFATHPKIAKEFAKHTKSMKKLPEHIFDKANKAFKKKKEKLEE